MSGFPIDQNVLRQINTEARLFFSGGNYEEKSQEILHLLGNAVNASRSLMLINRPSKNLLILDGAQSWEQSIEHLIDFLPLLYHSVEYTAMEKQEIPDLLKSLMVDTQTPDEDGAYFAIEKGDESIFFLFFVDQAHMRFSDAEKETIECFRASLEDLIRLGEFDADSGSIAELLDTNKKRQNIWLEALAWLNGVEASSNEIQAPSSFYETALFQLKMLVLGQSAVAFAVNNGKLSTISEHNADKFSPTMLNLLKSKVDWLSLDRKSNGRISNTSFSELTDVSIDEALVLPLRVAEKIEAVICLGKQKSFDMQEEMVANLFADGIQNIFERKRFLKSINEQNHLLKQEKEEQQKLIAQLKEAQDQLMQQEKMASIGQLAAGVAHEINNPVGYVKSNINAMANYIQDLYSLLDVYGEIEKRLPKEHALVKRLLNKKEEIDFDFILSDVEDLIAESKEGVVRVKQIVKDLKDFSHVDQADWQLTDLVKGIDSTLNIVHNELKYKANIRKDYEEIPRVQCVASQINQVVMNLLVNAGHAIQERGEITIRVFRKDEKFVGVSIQDTGSGIKPEVLSSIFNPFFTTKPVGKGTGLGLSLSYSIVEKHGGELLVESEVGVGTTFTMILPIEQAID